MYSLGRYRLQSRHPMHFSGDGVTISLTEIYTSYLHLYHSIFRVAYVKIVSQYYQILGLRKVTQGDFKLKIVGTVQENLYFQWNIYIYNVCHKHVQSPEYPIMDYCERSIKL